MNNQDIEVYQPASPAGPIAVFFAGLILLSAFIAGVIANWGAFLATSSVVTRIAIIVSGVVFCLAIMGYAVYHLVMFRYKLKLAKIRVQAMEDERRQKQERHDMELHLAQRTVHFDEQGNAALIGIHPASVVQLSGQLRTHPNLTTLHYTNKVDGLKGADQVAGLLGPGDIGKPTIAELVAAVERNSYQFGLGRSLQSRELILTELQDTHLKIIGGTRMGKSCGAASIIDQLRQTHDREHLWLALLDLENKTSRLFADDPHVMLLDTGYKKVKMHGRTVEQVAEYLVYLHQMMEWRYTLPDRQLAQLPAVLIYLEEFLYWKRILASRVNKQTHSEALTAFTGLATRGIKAKMHLMACAQVDYADEELRDAMAQFIGINLSFSVKPSAAQAAGFVSSDLLKQNYAARTPGQFVVEMIGGADLGVAPDFDVRAKLALLESGIVDSDTPAGQTVISEASETVIAERSELQPNSSRTTDRIELEPALQAKLAQVMENTGENMNDCLKRVWGASPGNNEKYRQAKQEYMQIQAHIHDLARRAMNG